MTKGKQSEKIRDLDPNDWHEVEPVQEEEWKPKAKGEELEGVFLAYRQIKTRFGVRQLAEFDSDGRKLVVWCPTRLGRLLDVVSRFPGLGCTVRIKYLGKVASGSKGGQAAHEFKVYARGLRSGADATG